ncbi:hypothetical protein PIB30_039101 [Stylosanthes scabra]|uniref:Uncharacterized protein n=1 Tax=Stylosanthes scabra TaxID=79078 RepID=A0ABU6ZCX7_9FABA|nr:hypothetical protein [Stylosanthes scabra]
MLERGGDYAYIDAFHLILHPCYSVDAISRRLAKTLDFEIKRGCRKGGELACFSIHLTIFFQFADKYRGSYSNGLKPVVLCACSIALTLAMRMGFFGVLQGYQEPHLS